MTSVRFLFTGFYQVPFLALLFLDIVLASCQEKMT
jgi:hypothetical protein